jgi:predicted XRE-type DNA-binding protein
MSANVIAESRASVSNRGMSPKESDILMAELKSWCEEKYGRQAEVAEAIGVSRQIVTDWIKGRAIPNLDNGLALRAFLQKQRKRESRPRKKE